jgi:hypothetical protein
MSLNRIVTVPSGAAAPERSGLEPQLEVEAALDQNAHAELLPGVERVGDQLQRALRVARPVALGEHRRVARARLRHEQR